MSKKKQSRKVASTRFRQRVFLLLTAVAVAVASVAAIYRRTTTSVHAEHAMPSTSVVFGPTVPNTNSPEGTNPADMVWIPGGEFSMGAQDPPDMNDVGMQASADSRPIHRVYVDGFYMDK